MKDGIVRIEITDKINGQGGWRFEFAKRRQSTANTLYRAIFKRLQMPLSDGEMQLQTTKADFEAGYDYQLGIDVILTFQNGQESTLQEKFLTWRESTVTVEYMQNHQTGEQGDWFSMKCDYYFVGYDRLKNGTFQEWILLNWPIARQLTNQNRVPWQIGVNGRDGARASFRFVPFTKMPPECVVLGFWNGQEQGYKVKADKELLEQKYYEQRAEQLLLWDNGYKPEVAHYGDYRSAGKGERR